MPNAELLVLPHSTAKNRATEAIGKEHERAPHGDAGTQSVAKRCLSHANSAGDSGEHLSDSFSPRLRVTARG